MPYFMDALKWKLKQGANALDIFNLLGNKESDSPKNDPDEKWSNLYRERQRNHLYKWVDVNKGNKGGELLEAYDKEGEEGIVRFANEKIAPLLFNDGTLLEKLRLSEYMKWKKALDANISGGTSEDSDTKDLAEVQKHFTEHFAQWRLNKRGIDGETVIHLLLNRDDAKCTEIAKLLIKLYPGLAIDIYEGNEFYGQSPLHLAIVHDDYEMVSVLLDAGADIKGRATGRFFLPEDQKKRNRARHTNYAGFAYFGEYPLAFAASFGNKDIFDLLIQNGADPNAQDSFGNTVLHICVINNSIEMYSYAVRHWAKPADTDVSNFAGYTPLTLATILGRREIFEAMLELTKVEFWRFSDMACSAYPLTTLDTIRPDGSTNWDSALMRVVSGSTADHLDIVGSEVIQRLLADKWRSFGHRKMYQRLILLIVHLLILSVAIYIRPSNAQDLWGRHQTGDIIRYFFECALLCSCCVFTFYQQGSEIRAQGLPGYLRTVIRAPDKILFLISNLLILMCIPCRMTEQYTLEETLLVLAMPGSWTYLLFFAKGYLLTGPFVIMIYSMISGDMVRFGVISLIFLVSFSQAFFFLGKDMKERQDANLCSVKKDDHVIEDYDAYFETALTLIRMSMGGYEYEDFDCASYQGFTKVLFVIYMIIMPIMLINMLIAMMGNTYTTIISQAEKAWRQQWAQLVILLERALDEKKLAKYQTEYSIKLSEDRFDQEDPGAMDTRALMVIKQTKKTRAKQRKQATASWKRLSRKVLAMIRTHGTERSRDVLHSHGQLPTSLMMMVSRPVSAAGIHPSHAALLSNLSRQPSLGISRQRSIGGALEHAITITHVVDTMRNSPGPPAVPQFDRTSPQLVVHAGSSGPTGDTPGPQTPRNQLSVEYRSSIDVQSASAAQTAASPPPPAVQLFDRPLTQQTEPQNLAPVPQISSPNSPSNELSTDSPGVKKKRLDPTSRDMRSFQLQPLSVETLPTAHQPLHHTRGPSLARKRHFASKQPLTLARGGGTVVARPNLPPAHPRHSGGQSTIPTATSRETSHESAEPTTATSTADRRNSSGFSPFHHAIVTPPQLPNMPEGEEDEEGMVDGSSPEDSLDTNSTTGIIATPKNTASSPMVQRPKTISPPTSTHSPGAGGFSKKKDRLSLDQGKKKKS